MPLVHSLGRTLAVSVLDCSALHSLTLCLNMNTRHMVQSIGFVHVVDPHTCMWLGNWPMKLDNSGFKQAQNLTQNSHNEHIAPQHFPVVRQHICKFCIIMYYSIRLLFLIFLFPVSVSVLRYLGRYFIKQKMLVSWPMDICYAQSSAPSFYLFFGKGNPHCVVLSFPIWIGKFFTHTMHIYP